MFKIIPSILKYLLPTKAPNITQVNYKTSLVYIPDWNKPWSTCGPRSRHYKPNIYKRIAAHGLQTRLQTRGGNQILWRKIIKGKHGMINLVVAP